MEQKEESNHEEVGLPGITLHFHFQRHSHLQPEGRRWGAPGGLFPCPGAPTSSAGAGYWVQFWLLSNYSQELRNFSLGLDQVSFSGNQLFLKCHGPCPDGWLSWLEHCPIHQKVVGSIPGQGIHLGCRFDPWSGRI